jgi:DNA-binding NarL/FixJ family response regulator
MSYDTTCIAIDEARAETQLSTTDQLFEETDDRRAYGSGGAKLGGFIAVIESRTFIRECIRRSVQSAFAQPVLTYSTAAELEQQHLFTSAQLIIFSWVEDNTEASTNALKVLCELAPRIPVIVLGYNNDAELARSAICHGAKGYIPVTMGFEIAIAAVRFVLAGGPMRQWIACFREIRQASCCPNHQDRTTLQAVNCRSLERSRKASRIR